MTLPVILAVDEDAAAIERITKELQRYARDYRVGCGRSTEAALEQLETMRDQREPVAVVLAARGTHGLKGEELLARVNDLHPHAKRGLLIEFGGWGDEDTADAIRHAMARGHIDYYVLKPWADPDELFHRTISEFLHEWRRATTLGRREITIVADTWSRRGYELRNERDANGFVVTGADFETSLQGAFAIGDVRAGSVKRVASAVGEGSVVIQQVHRHLEASHAPAARG